MAGPRSGNRAPKAPADHETIGHADRRLVVREDDPAAPLAVTIGDAAKMLGNGAAVLVQVANALAHLAYEAGGLQTNDSNPPAGIGGTTAPIWPRSALVNASTAAGILGISLAALRKRVQRGAFARGVVVYAGRRYQFRRDRLV